MRCGEEIRVVLGRSDGKTEGSVMGFFGAVKCD
jgi:hypothetical protein